ncbi:Leucine-rich repeat neuronal protein 2-like protein [Leptotrombidium deliense]|uniref:Leucine-rich repeat neuronal protein 2-like protein n=1 Tax=Leptotrombidium deliense TaxID=299467 RepID=A0A443SVS4_9ACAR|nr:Leucine-rich repeat neuronal protein 2-like protein [Leptotrombidium deliense]
MSGVFVAAFCPQQCICNDTALEVRCKNSNLGVIPHTLNPNIRKLLLIDNQIRRIRRSSFEVYQNLEVVDMSGNNLTTIEDNAFASQHKLKLETLDLTRNEITFLDANAFEGLSKLRYLNLRDNRLGNEPSDHTINVRNGSSIHVFSLPALSPRFLPNLKRLDLGLNRLNGIAKRSSPFWSGIESSSSDTNSHTRQTRSSPAFWSLEELLLDGCSLRFIERGALNGLSSLLILRIQANKFEEIPKDSLNDVSSLQVLQIGQNPFEKINSKAFSSLKSLKSLDVSRCSLLTRIDPFAFVNIDQLQRLELSYNPNLKFLDADVFNFLTNLRYLSLRGNALSTLDPKFESIGNQVDILDVRDNPFICNCSLQWIRKLIIGYKNQSTVELSTEQSLSNVHNMQRKKRVEISFDSLLPEALRQLPPNKSGDSHSPSSFLTIRSYALRVIDVKCANPPPLREKLLIDLDADDIGCFEVESMAPIVIAVIIAFLIVFGVIIICCITCRTRLTVLIKGTSGKSHYPSKFVEPVNNNRKVFGFTNNRRINDLEYQYSRPDCIVVRNTGNFESSPMNNLSNPYEITPVPGIRESIYATLDEGMPCVFKLTPTTEL